MPTVNAAGLGTWKVTLGRSAEVFLTLVFLWVVAMKAGMSKALVELDPTDEVLFTYKLEEKAEEAEKCISRCAKWLIGTHSQNQRKGISTNNAVRITNVSGEVIATTILQNSKFKST